MMKKIKRFLIKLLGVKLEGKDYIHFNGDVYERLAFESETIEDLIFTEEQLECITQQAKLEGFLNLQSYIRYVIHQKLYDLSKLSKTTEERPSL